MSENNRSNVPALIDAKAPSEVSSSQVVVGTAQVLVPTTDVGEVARRRTLSWQFVVLCVGGLAILVAGASYYHDRQTYLAVAKTNAEASVQKARISAETEQGREETKRKKNKEDNETKRTALGAAKDVATEVIKSVGEVAKSSPGAVKSGAEWIWKKLPSWK